MAATRATKSGFAAEAQKKVNLYEKISFKVEKTCYNFPVGSLLLLLSSWAASLANPNGL